MGPTIHDVARLAGTSKSTVSRFLNGQKVKKETEEALEKAIKDLNFHRNANARRLVLDKTHTIAIVVDDISNVFYSGIIKGIERVANRNGYNCIFLSWTSNYEKERAFLDLLYEGQVDGMIMVSFRKRDWEDLLAIRAEPYPIVLIGDHGEMDGIFSVDVDNKAGISEIVTYLHSIGHRNIAYINGPDDAAASQYRLKGYMQTMERLGLKVEQEWIVKADWTNRGGFTAMEQLLEIEGITAVVASNDETAIGALRALQERGKSVPRDMSLVGFDDISISSWVYPTLTTVRQPYFEIGITAAEGLFKKVEGDPDVDSRSYLLKPKLVVRDSCGILGSGGGL